MQFRERYNPESTERMSAAACCRGKRVLLCIWDSGEFAGPGKLPLLQFVRAVAVAVAAAFAVGQAGPIAGLEGSLGQLCDPAGDL